MPKVKIGFSFLLFNALIFIFRDSQLIMGFYGACIVHELGHILAIYFTKGELLSVEFSWTGIKIVATAPKCLKSGIFVQISGPIMNLIVFLMLISGGKTGYFAVFCLAEGVLNLLPYKCLDGGSVLEMLAESSRHEKGFRRFNSFLRIFSSLIFAFILFRELSKLIPFLLTF